MIGIYDFKVPDRYTSEKIVVRPKKWTYEVYDRFTIGLRQGILM